jgi:hypothetical protein
LIKTPKQLVTVVVLSFIVPIALILLTINVITGGINVDPDSPAMSDEAVAKRLKPGSEALKKAGGGAAASVAVAARLVTMPESAALPNSVIRLLGENV